MLHLLYNFALLPLAQEAFDAPTDTPAPPPAPHRFSFSDLQKGLQDTNTGTANDRHFVYLLLTMVAMVIILAVLLQLRERRKAPAALNSPSKLARELSRKIRFPFGTRLLLKWVAGNTRLPLATLLISARTFDVAIDAWVRRPTFNVIRRWGYGRLQLLRCTLFEPVAANSELRP
ncbi:MAG TPA: hypothetical protein VM008_08655 [Phycisphaerae bacterium]|nr:hypothetical protein [Phycisphaerae bacterium]